MADDKAGREAQARNAERRQRARDIEAALERGDEPEPPLDSAATAALAERSYPATAEDVVADVGDLAVEAGGETVAIGDLLAASDREVFDSPASVRRRVSDPGVARAMRRIVEAPDTRVAEPLRGSQREAYEKTFRALADVDALDDDAVVDAIEEWVLDRVADTGAFPGSRAVRRQAAKVCRSQGHVVGTDEWLGV